MITREELRKLAELEVAPAAAISFYFQPQRPQDKSHRGEAILVRDVFREALRTAERERESGKSNGSVRADLERILAMAEQLHGNHARAKAVFACGAKDIWQEFDLPPRLPRTQLMVNSRFHLAPLAVFLDGNERRCVIALVDRERARIFDLWQGAISERAAFVDPLPRRVRSDGYLGYEAGHRERHVDNEAMHHYKHVVEQLQAQALAGGFELLLIGCHDENRPEIEPHLAAPLKQRLLGWFVVDPAVASAEQVREEAERRLEELRLSEQAALVREVIGEASRNGRGSLGLKHVLSSLERGEVQRLLLGESFAAMVAQCTNCGHLDTRMVRSCAMCGKPTRELTDVTDTLVLKAIRDGVQLVRVAGDEEFEHAGNIAALLRFRADQNTAQKLAG
jgi:peptide subunit release factor 1 (eRF1)